MDVIVGGPDRYRAASDARHLGQYDRIARDSCLVRGRCRLLPPMFVAIYQPGHRGPRHGGIPIIPDTHSDGQDEPISKDLIFSGLQQFDFHLEFLDERMGGRKSHALRIDFRMPIGMPAPIGPRFPAAAARSGVTWVECPRNYQFPVEMKYQLLVDE
ncbi:hypothetical protein [Bordetella genomosp. 9]|uniref:hypothetical protein n=1 Tax=Bordetella genomosp. 9 TaxID=1416803 RepID=UPI0011782D6B|nr:hypothetical protein [Bordetella genomosp. 9]